MIHTLAIAALAVGLTMLLVDRVQRRPAGFTMRGDTGYLIVGRDAYRDADASIRFGLGLRNNPEPGEYRFRLGGHISWNWPRPVWYMAWPGCGPIYSDGIASEAWTGRPVGGWCIEQPYFSRGLRLLPP